MKCEACFLHNDSFNSLQFDSEVTHMAEQVQGKLHPKEILLILRVTGMNREWTASLPSCNLTKIRYTWCISHRSAPEDQAFCLVWKDQPVEVWE